jgi:hypothetical protein
VKRFIPHDELARDNRFIRQNALVDVMANLPDDVDQVVEAFDRLAPMMEVMVRGSAFEELYDTFGPGFLMTVLNEPIVAGDPHAEIRLKVRVHGIFAGELQALEGAGRTLWV